MKRAIFALAAISGIAACTKDTGILETSTGIYLISISAPQVSFGPPIQQKADAYEQATEFCRKKGRRLETIDLQEVNQVFGRHGSVSLEFMCVEAA